MDIGPKKLTKGEWTEIAKVTEVREAWGLDGEEDERCWKEGSYGVRFNYTSDGPGYSGDLFVLLGGVPECPPIILVRRQGQLQVVDSSNY